MHNKCKHIKQNFLKLYLFYHVGYLILHEFVNDVKLIITK